MHFFNGSTRAGKAHELWMGSFFDAPRGYYGVGHRVSGIGRIHAYAAAQSYVEVITLWRHMALDAVDLLGS